MKHWGVDKEIEDIILSLKEVVSNISNVCTTVEERMLRFNYPLAKNAVEADIQNGIRALTELNEKLGTDVDIKDYESKEIIRGWKFIKAALERKRKREEYEEMVRGLCGD